METAIVELEDREPPGQSWPEAADVCIRKQNDTEEHSKIIPLKSPLRFHSSERTKAFRKRFYPDISLAEWNDWRWQVRNRITELQELDRIIQLTEDEASALSLYRRTLPMAVTPYYASLLDEVDASQPLRRTVVPLPAEQVWSPGEAADPLEEESDSPVPGLVHRYPDRVLFLVTGFCSTYCRYCTRSRMVGSGASYHTSRERWQQALDYIAATPTVRDVLLSGGDPLTLSDEALDWLLSRLRDISHVELIRIGTKAPVVLPYRVTPGLTRLLRQYHPLWMSIHFTLPEELTPEVVQACQRLADAGIPLGSQTVLLAGVNDTIQTMTCLVQGLLRIRVKPYYLYQCDPIVGSAHFRTPVSTGLKIISGLRGHTTGYAVPTYVIDAPGGGGKIPLLPEYAIGHEGDDLVLRNYQGNLYRYFDPLEPTVTASCCAELPEAAG